VHIGVHIRILVHIGVHIRILVHIGVHIRILVHIGVHIRILVHIGVHVRILLHIGVHIRMLVHIGVHIRILLHIGVHIRILLHSLGRPPFNNLDMNETGIGGRGGQMQDRACHAQQRAMFYHRDRPAWDQKAFQNPIRIHRSESSYPQPAYYSPGATLAGGVPSRAEAAMKTSSTIFSIEESRKRPARLTPSSDASSLIIGV
jgi:hypothetical protein